MKTFLKDVLIFSLPIIVIGCIFGFFYFIGYRTNEFEEIDTIIQEQRDNHVILVGLGYGEQTAYYKKENANYYHAEVIALGTSRVMQYKDSFFDTSFYNCGGSVAGNFNEYRNFLQNLEYTPSMIILGLDDWIFNDTWNRSCREVMRFELIRPVNRNKVVMTLDIIKDFLKQKWSISELNNYTLNKGFGGAIKDAGFMYDGSYYYGNVYRNPQNSSDFQFKDTLERIKEGRDRFEYGIQIDSDTLIQLDLLLKYCSENDIYVLGVRSPFAPSIYQKMVQSGDYGYLSKIPLACKDLFSQYDFAYFDYANCDNLAISDEYFIDGFHGSEVAYGMMVENMIYENVILREKVNEEHLSSLLDHAYSTLTFDNPNQRFIE